MRNIRLYAGLIVCLVLSAPLLHCGELAAGQKKDILKFNKMYERGSMLRLLTLSLIALATTVRIRRSCCSRCRQRQPCVMTAGWS